MDFSLIIGIIIGIATIIILIRFLFRTNKGDEFYKVSSSDIDFEIQNLRHHLRKKKDFSKEHGELMDNLMEEYYKGLENEKR
jgi:uncharacterized membrane-anchored protein YhcB (DUF1043 family)